MHEILKYVKKQGIPVALASSTRKAAVMEHLDRAGITSYFQKIICGDMVEHGKPAPDIYLKACEELGVAPGQALAVEDSFNGIRSAYAAGLYTVMVTDQHGVGRAEDGSQILPQADAVVNPHGDDCSYPFGGIGGGVVAYKLVQVL